MRIGVNCLFVIAIETRRIAEQKPQLRIVGCSFDGALRVIPRLRVISVLQGHFCGAAKPGVLDI